MDPVGYERKGIVETSVHPSKAMAICCFFHPSPTEKMHLGNHLTAGWSPQMVVKSREVPPKFNFPFSLVRGDVGPKPVRMCQGVSHLFVCVCVFSLLVFFCCYTP